MRCLAIARLMLLFLAVIALSTDTAAKVLHGIAHQREAHAWMDHGLRAHRQSLAPDGEHQGSSVDAPDVDANHLALHGAVAATVLPTILMAVAAIVQMPMATIEPERSALSHFVAQAPPPWIRARPTQPRAPPLG